MIPSLRRRGKRGGYNLTNNATQDLHTPFHTRRHNRKCGNLSGFARKRHACRLCGDLSHHDRPHLCPDLQQGRASCYRELRQGSALHDAAVDYLCFMPDLSVAQVGICEVASCRRADLYDICRDCQHCYETSGAGIINDNEDNTICNSCEVSPYNCIDIIYFKIRPLSLTLKDGFKLQT